MRKDWDTIRFVADDSESTMNNRVSAHSYLFLAAGLGTLLMTPVVGCAPASLQSVRISTITEPLPRPDHILVYDFAVLPEDVSPYNSFAYQLQHHQVNNTSQTEDQVRVGRAVANALSEKLVKEIRSLGLPAERASARQPLVRGTFSIEGEFVSIDGGNRVQRIGIAFGGGATKFRTLVQGYLGTAEGRELVEEFETNIERSQIPRMAVMVGASSAGGKTEFMKTAEADAYRTTTELAKQLTEFFTVQGWIAQDMIP